jgi:hypothetical protein
MEAILGVSLYSYLYLKLAKMPCLSYYLLCFLFNKIREQEGRTGSAWKRECGEVCVGRWPNVYTHVSKCKNDKRKKKRQRNKHWHKNHHHKTLTALKRTSTKSENRRQNMS